MTRCEVAVVGAGPYGLSIAAHLRARAINFRIFGSPMHTWLTHMPKGMLLKSEGFATSLYDPHSTFTLATYCKENALPYADTGLPTPLETFAAYGLEFQRRFVPELENKLVVSLQRCSEGYRVQLADGEDVIARRVVVAVGLSHFEYIPPVLSALPKTLLSHSALHSTLEHFRDREVVVVGAGASALDMAALLHQARARVQIVARKPVISFQDPPTPHGRSFLEQLWKPGTGIGVGWKMVLCAHAPLVFRQMPERFRLEKVRRTLGPAPGWFTKELTVGKVPFNLGVAITEANAVDGRVRLQLTDDAGAKRTLEADHVIAATGYRVDLRRLTFVHSTDLAQIHSVEQTPVLSSNFESSLPGLYFVGTAAANTFGPLLRFALGAKFTAKRLARHLARIGPRKSGA